MASMRRVSAVSDTVKRGTEGGRTQAHPPPADYSRVQVCDLHRTFSTQPFMLSELPETVPEPL